VSIYPPDSPIAFSQREDLFQLAKWAASEANAAAEAIGGTISAGPGWVSIRYGALLVQAEMTPSGFGAISRVSVVLPSASPQQWPEQDLVDVSLEAPGPWQAEIRDLLAALARARQGRTSEVDVAQERLGAAAQAVIDARRARFGDAIAANGNLWADESDMVEEFYQIRVTADRALDDDEAFNLFGAIGYAFRENLRGEELGLPQRESPNCWTADYDITKSRSDDWGYRLGAALTSARRYAVEGSPVRTTDRTGPRGTRLVEGLGPISLRFEFN
jgi:hypothetical protein